MQGADNPDADDEEELTFPNPSNFPQRLMNILDSGIAPDAIWWVGDGDEFAIHPGNVQSSTLLVDHFQGNRYSSFVRNLNRWGYSRVHYVNGLVPTASAYRCSLFRRGQSELVKFMEMDSTIQKEFDRHRADNEEKPPAQREDDLTIVRRVAKQLAGYLGEHLEPEPQQQPAAIAPHPPPRAQASASGQDSQQVVGYLAGMLAQRQGQQQQAAQGQNQNSANDLAAILGMLQNGQQQAPAPSQPQPQPSTSTPATASLPVQNSSVSRDQEILRQIILLAEEFLALPQSQASEDEESIRSVMSLLILLARQRLQHSQAPPAPAPPPAPTSSQQIVVQQPIGIPQPQQAAGGLQQLLLSQLSSGLQQPEAQQPPAASQQPRVPPPSGQVHDLQNQLRVAMQQQQQSQNNLLGQLEAQLQQQQQNHQQHNQQQAVFGNLLGQLTHGLQQQGTTLSPASSNAPAQHNAGMVVQQSLQQILQQQQQQRQTGQNSALAQALQSFLGGNNGS